MTQYRKSVFAPMLAMAALSALTPARADEWNKEIDVTFSDPVEVPGVVLAAGSYIFRIANSQADRHIVQILRADDDDVIATVIAAPTTREKATDTTVITFEERPAGQPEAIREWFYAGETSGLRFIYGKPAVDDQTAAAEDADDEDETPARSSRVEPAWPNPFHYVVIIPLPDPEPRDTADTDVE